MCVCVCVCVCVCHSYHHLLPQSSMEDFWRDFNHVPLITSTPHHLPPSSASKLHDFFIQSLPIGSPSSASVTDPSFPSSPHKRLSGSDGDRRSKRMIKNRESAARSRARKQAYTNELEQKCALLKEENAMLTKQLQQLDGDPETNKHKLKMPPYRSLTAPF